MLTLALTLLLLTSTSGFAPPLRAGAPGARFGTRIGVVDDKVREGDWLFLLIIYRGHGGKEKEEEGGEGTIRFWRERGDREAGRRETSRA